MMLSPETLHLVIHEQHKDLLRELDRRQLVQLAEQQNAGAKPYNKAAGLLGTYMVKLGTKLQSLDRLAQPNHATEI